MKRYFPMHEAATDQEPDTQKNGHTDECPVCEGAGEVAPYRQSFTGGTTNTTICPRCMGKGHATR